MSVFQDTPRDDRPATAASAINRDQALNLASLLCSRLCHDLLSPVGALSNGLELLAEERDPQMRQRCLDLLAQSAQVSADKLKFFRLAFGAAGGLGDTSVPMAEPRALIEALIGAGRQITLGWAVSSEALPKSAVKVLLNFALIAIEALARGGNLDIAMEVKGADVEVAVRACGPRIAFDPVVGLALEGRLEPDALSSRTAPAAMLAHLVAGTGGTMQFVLTEEALVLGAMMPLG